NKKLQESILTGLCLVYGREKDWNALRSLSKYETLETDLGLLSADRHEKNAPPATIEARYKKLLAKHNNHPRVLTGLAWHYFYSGNYSSALKFFQQVKKSLPAVSRLGSARCYELMGDDKQAKISYEYFSDTDYYSGQLGRVLYREKQESDKSKYNED